MKHDMICVSCPIGCLMTVEHPPSDGFSVRGNRCPRGLVYARAEVLDPQRMVSATCAMAVSSDTAVREYSRLPCRTSSAFPRDRIEELLALIYALRLSPPVRRGDIILPDALGTGIDVIATDNRV